jgi:hypothetical protein
MESLVALGPVAPINSLIGLALILLVSVRLARRHPMVWEQLGGNLASLFRGKGALNFVRFVLSSQHIALHDPLLSLLVWSLRVTLGAGILAFSVWVAMHLSVAAA